MVERIAERLQPMLLFLVYGAIGAILAGASSGCGWHGGMDDMGMLRGASLCSCAPQHTAASGCGRGYARFERMRRQPFWVSEQRGAVAVEPAAAWLAEI